MKKANLTKDYLEKQGWKLHHTFATNLEIWSKKSQIMLVNKKTRKQVFMLNKEDENGESNG